MSIRITDYSRLAVFFSNSKPGAKINEGNVAVELNIVRGKNSMLSTDEWIMWSWLWCWKPDARKSKLYSFFLFVCLLSGPGPVDYANAFISVPVNNY